MQLTSINKHVQYCSQSLHTRQPNPIQSNADYLYTPPNAVAVTQSQSEVEDVPGINVLLSAIDEVHDDVFDETLLAQKPIIESPSQPILAAATQSSPSLS